MHRYVRIASIAAAVLTIAACGKAATPAAAPVVPDTTFPGQTAAQILGSAKQALASAKSVRMDGVTSSSGTDVTLRLAVLKGKGSAGAVTLGEGKLKIVMVGKDTYSQPSASLLTQLGPIGTSIGTALEDKWMKADASSLAAIAGGAAASDSAALMSSFDSTGSALDQSIPVGSTLTRVPGKAVNGIQTTGVHFVPGGDPAAAAKLSGTLYVAAAGTPYPLLLERPGMHLELSHWNQKVTITAPPANQIMSMDDLGLAGMGSAGDLASQLSGASG